MDFDAMQYNWIWIFRGREMGARLCIPSALFHKQASEMVVISVEVKQKYKRSTIGTAAVTRGTWYEPPTTINSHQICFITIRCWGNKILYANAIK